ncbi:hypothetical protein LOCC1_G006789 [Lachnellula occidentalis]|uniref:Rhodopsin domain-containing protein n=1 Tax=Lachnellula occidentalis TaxID=215460 RepID=A0A8H8RKU7_9HELO|nr:hypothetical protein LOCC1_G006789 [Lachnellula occidentalis]
MLSLLAESWTWYAVAVLIVIARYVSRWLHLGSFKRFQTEDYVMVVVFGFYTCLIVCMNIVAHLDTNLILPSDMGSLTPESITSRIRGSKYVLIVEQSMIMTIWGCKICLLLMYRNLTFGLKQRWAVKAVGVYVILNWVIMEVLYFGVWCRPFPQYWAVPVTNTQCSAATHHLVVNAVFNISSDVMMLCIPLPLLINSKLPRTKKFILCVLFSLGIFVILCAVLNKYYSFAHPFSPQWTFWYIREASTAIYVANMPMCWALMRRLFNLRSFNLSSNNSRSRSKSFPLTSHGRGTVISNGRTLNDEPTKGGEGKKDKSWWDREGYARGESEEHIVREAEAAKVPKLEVWETKEFEIDREDGEGKQFATDGQDPNVTRMYDGGDKNTTTVTATRAPIARGDSVES